MSSNRLLSSIWDPLGLLLGNLLALKMAETSIGIPLGAAKSRSRALFSTLALQERSYRPPGAVQEAKRRQEASRETFWTHLEPF